MINPAVSRIARSGGGLNREACIFQPGYGAGGACVAPRAPPEPRRYQKSRRRAPCATLRFEAATFLAKPLTFRDDALLFDILPPSVFHEQPDRCYHQQQHDDRQHGSQCPRGARRVGVWFVLEMVEGLQKEAIP